MHREQLHISSWPSAMVSDAADVVNGNRKTSLCNAGLSMSNTVHISFYKMYNKIHFSAERFTDIFMVTCPTNDILAAQETLDTP